MMERFKAGRYYVGDPCYVIPDELWDDAINAYQVTEEQAASFDVSGNRVWFADCVEGESDYTDGNRTYVNDTTLLGLVPEALVKPEGADDDGPIQEFPNDFHVERTGDGVLFIGHLMIDTAHPVYEEDEEDEEVCCGGGCEGDCGCTCEVCMPDIYA